MLLCVKCTLHANPATTTKTGRKKKKKGKKLKYSACLLDDFITCLNKV